MNIFRRLRTPAKTHKLVTVNKSGGTSYQRRQEVNAAPSSVDIARVASAMSESGTNTTFGSDAEAWAANMTDGDLRATYSGADCHQLARYLAETHPERFAVCVATSGLDDNYNPTSRYPAHWFVRDVSRGTYLDVYGGYENPEDVLVGWDEFADDDTVEFAELDTQSAIELMDAKMSNFPLPVFYGDWQGRAKIAVERLGLLQPAA